MSTELTVSKDEAHNRLYAQIDKGRELLKSEIQGDEEIERALSDKEKWSRFNRELVSRIYNSNEYLNELTKNQSTLKHRNALKFGEQVHYHQKYIKRELDCLESFVERLELISVALAFEPKEMSTMPSLDVFISHSSKNKEIAAAVIGLLRSALNISATKIRCTSVDGYKLPGGASVDDQLRQETQDSRCFIGIVTQDAIESTFTIFELGARWGASKPFIPIVPTPADKNLLKRPLSDLNALLLINPAEVHQLVGDVARMLGLEQERPEVFRDRAIAL